MYPTLKDEESLNSLAKKGYAVFPALLPYAEVKALLDYALAHTDRYTSSFHTTHFSKDVAYKKEAHEMICSLVAPRVAPIVDGYEPIFGNFMIKLPDPQVAMPLHADWTYVNESRARSLSVWIPLVDTDVQNGCIGVVEASHRVTNSVRGPNIKQSSTLEQDAIWAQKYGKLIPLKAGDALIYDHGLLHFSPANKSNKIRPALNLSMVPAGEQVIHFCIPAGADQIEQYSVADTSFFMNYENFQRPRTGTLIRQMPKDSVKYIDPRMRFFHLKKLLGII